MPVAVKELLQQPEYRDFALDDFDPKTYANRILQALPGNPFHNLDISTALSKLSFSIEHLQGTIQNQVVENYEQLLQQVSSLRHLESVVTDIKDGIADLQTSFDKSKQVVYGPYQEISLKTKSLEKAQDVSDKLRHICRFLTLVGRLELLSVQVTPGETRVKSDVAMDWIKAALVLHEIDEIMAQCNLSDIHVIQNVMRFVSESKEKILATGNTLLTRGLVNNDLSDMATSLQIFSHLDILVDRVKDTLTSTVKECGAQTRALLDGAEISKRVKEIPAPGPKSSVRRVNEPQGSDTSSKAWNLVLWKNLEALTDALYKNCIQVYTLEQCLEKMRDSNSRKTFLELINKAFNGPLRTVLWKNIGAILDREIRAAIKASTFLQQTFQLEYPRLLRLFHDFLSRIAVASGHFNADFLKSVESSAVLKALSHFEASYLSRSLSRLLDPVNNAFPDRGLVPTRLPPKKDDVDRILRVIASELEASRFDPHLAGAVCKNIQKAIGMYLIKVDQLATTDSGLSAFLNSAPAAPSFQIFNTDIINCLWWFKESLYLLSHEYSYTTVQLPLYQQSETITKHLTSVVEPLYSEIARNLEATLLKMHKEDYNKSLGKGSKPVKSAGSDHSLYLGEFINKLKWLAREILLKLRNSETVTWNRLLCCRILDFFVRHASIIRPLNEDGRLQLAGDMTQLEFALSQWMNGLGIKLEADSEIQESYKVFRSFKPILFLDLEQLQEPKNTDGLPSHIILHHLFVRAFPNMSLPPWHFGWTELQYSEWLDANPGQSVALLERCVDIYAEEVKRRGEKEYCAQFPIIRSVLQSHKSS